MFEETDLPALAISKASANTMLALPGIAGNAYELEDDLRRYLALFTYLSDKAAWEYQTARQHMLAWNNEREKNGSAFMLPTPVSFSLDNCITTLHRLLRALQALSTGKNHVLMDGSARKAIETYFETVNAMRDVLHHTESRLRPDHPKHIPAGLPLTPYLAFGSGTIRLGPHSIRSAELKDMVEKVHAIALEVATRIKRFENLPKMPVTNADRS
jgi:hypothetical protein